MGSTPTDVDEMAYLLLSQNISWTFQNYSTRGSVIDRAMGKNLYSSPVFHHPPLVPYLIKIFSCFFNVVTAAKIVNFLFIIPSILLVFGIASKFTDFKGALVAVMLWSLCPVFNLESSLVHLDVPLTVLLLAGIYLFLTHKVTKSKGQLLAAAFFFALAMLTKYTSTIYIIIPLAMIAADKESRRDKGTVYAFLAILALGFLWWFYIFMQFGSLVPTEFMGISGPRFESPYLKSISRRQWYYPWVIFLSLCPLAILYIVGGLAHIGKLFHGKTGIFSSRPDVSLLFIISLASLACVVLFNIANAFTNGYWIMRHNMPMFPIIYITLGYIVSALLDKKNEIVTAYLVMLLFITGVFMSMSSFLTLSNITQLRPIPSILFWIPGLKSLFI